MSSVGTINISLIILVAFESRRFKKTYIDVSNNTFPLDTGIIKSFHYMGNLFYS